MQPTCFYVVRFWVSPEAEADLIAWIDDGHLQDVVDQPGFLWGQRITLNDKADDGWQGYLNIYALESEDALQAYFGSGAQAGFAKESARFQGQMRIDRTWGTLAFEVQHQEQGAAT